MTGLDEKIAAETLKTASGILLAAIGPKIEKVRNWALEKELQGKLKADTLAETMEQYLNKLSHRVSEITSITFQQVRLDIFAAYEPLFMCELNLHEHYFTFAENLAGNDEDESLRDLEDLLYEDNVETVAKIDNGVFTNSKNTAFLIIDSAGMGKSTFSKFIIANTIFKSEKIPLLIELRKLNPKINLIESLAKELDFPGRPFDRALFYRLLELGKFFIILDGFDEVKIEDQNDLANEIHSLSSKGGKNTLLVTSRPQDIIPDLVNSKALRFLPFTTVQAISLLNRYDKISSLDIGKRLEQEIRNIPVRFIESPLLVSLLYRTFGVNNSIAERISTFYEEIYHALYKGHDLINKNGFAREKKSKLDFEDFRKLLRGLAHYMMLSRKFSFKNWSEAISSITKATEISGTRPESASEFLDDLLVAVPLMQRDGNEYKFYHKTIIEYFAAEFVIYNPSNSELLGKILKSRVCSGYFKVFDFICDMNKPLYDKVITSYFANKAKSYCKSSGLTSRFIETTEFLAQAAIGLWQPPDDTPDDEIIKILLDDEKFKECPYNAISWIHGTLNKKQCVLVISWEKKHENLHKDAWEAISFVSGDLSEQVLEFDDVRKYVALDDWTEINRTFMRKVKIESTAIDSVCSIAISSAISSSRAEVRLLCPNKVEKVINDLKKQDQLRVELERFL